MEPRAELAARAGELWGAATPVAVARGIEALRRTVWDALREELAAQPDLVAELAERLALICDELLGAALDRLAAGADDEMASFVPEEPSEPSEPVAPVAPAAAAQPFAPAAAAEPFAPPDPVVPVVPVVSAPANRPGSLWVAALEDEIGAADGLPLSLLQAELEDAERLQAALTPAAPAPTFSDLFAQAIRGRRPRPGHPRT